ncbi:unnamed protein product, partial [Heterosigma akashiwo]
MPLIFLGVHWAAGFVFMLICSIFATELRKILHRDILRDWLPTAHEEMGEFGGGGGGALGLGFGVVRLA